MPQLPLGFSPLEGFAARDFVVSPPNLEAWTRLGDFPGGNGGALALVGPAASGKSHLANLWAQRLCARTLAADAPAGESLAEQSAFVLVEDVDGGFDDAALFHLINRGLRPGGGLLLTAQTPPQTWPTALPDLRSRLNALSVVTLGAPDDAVLEGMLQKAFRARRILPPQDLLSYLVRRLERSAAAAEAAVERLDSEAAAQHRPVGRRLAQELFAEGRETPKD